MADLTDVARTGEREHSVPGATLALTLLIVINFFNYVDRQMLASVESLIETEFFPVADYPRDDHEVRARVEFLMGSLNMAFMVSYMLFAPLFGLMADRVSRWLLVAIGVSLWSLASGASGLANLFWVLFVTRCFVGIGEAVYGPVAPTLISDMYPVSRRGAKLAWFYMAIPVGSACGYILGGQVSEFMESWRWPFYVVVIPGLLLGVWCLLMKEPPRGLADRPTEVPPEMPPSEIPPPDTTFKAYSTGIQAGPAALPADSGGIVDGAPPPLMPAAAKTQGFTPPRKATFKDYLVLLKTRSYVLNTLGMTALTFAMGGIAFWMPRYVALRQVQETVLAGNNMEGVDAEKAAKYREIKNRLADTEANKKLDPEAKKRAQQREREDYRFIHEFEGDAVRPILGQVNLIFGGIVVISGLGATLLGGLAGDWLKPRFPGSYFMVSSAAMFAGFPMVLLSLFLPFPLAWGFIFLACFCLFFNTGPTNAILANVTHPSVRATGFAVNILVIHALGDAVSPMILGYINGRTGNMNVGFVVVSAMFLVAAVLWAIGSRYLEEDTRRAPTRLS